ncbi:hypothetical protein QLX08_008431 [Tetragonisca angustula]|uniref:Odorant receptor n=1 Tax=Tetragonisca angustula TaxID=166442 RepID=A0AAW0ZMZ8_9HYME
MMSNRSISRLIVIGLRLTGIWPDSSYEIVVRCIWIVIMVFGQILQYRYIIKQISCGGNLTNVIDGLSTALPYSLLFFKLISFWINRRLFKNMLMEMSQDWINSSKFNIDAMINKTKLAYRYSKLIMIVYAIAVFTYAGVFLEISRQNQDEEFNITSRQLLIKMDFPFTYYESPLYEYVFVLQFFQLFSNASAIAMLNALIIILIFHVGGQIEMLHEALENIFVKNHKSLRNVVKPLIDLHYQIILGSENIENLFSYIALMQLLCNTLIICCIGFLIIVALNLHMNIEELINILLFYIAITLEAFVFSYAGEYLSNKSLSISTSAYGSSWYLLDPRDRRIIILLMIRSQRQLTITAGKFMDLSMQTFANIIRTSASYISILYAMY